MISAPSTGSVYVFDSHSHGPFPGALVLRAVANSKATMGSKVEYLSTFLTSSLV